MPKIIVIPPGIEFVNTAAIPYEEIMRYMEFRLSLAMKNIRVTLAVFISILTVHATSAIANTEDVKHRVQTDLNGKCLELFLSDKFVLFSPSEIGYQYYATALLDNVVFALGEINFHQYCGYARKPSLLSWEDAEKRAITACEKGRPKDGPPCEVYAHNNDIVYVNIHEKLKTAKQLFAAGDSAANRAIAEVGEKVTALLTPTERGEYEYLVGKVLSDSKIEHDKVLAIGYFNSAWSKYENVSSAVEEGNLRMAASDMDKNWQPIRAACEYFLAHASDEQRALHPEVEQNLKQTESYYQAKLASQKEDATKQAQIGAIAAERETKKQAILAKEQEKQARIDTMQAQQQVKQGRLDAIKTARKEQHQEKIRQAEAKRIAREGDGSEDDTTCKSFGARPGSDGYVNCRIQLSSAKKLADERQSAQKASDALVAQNAAAAAQKAASDAAASQMAQIVAEFNHAKKCVDETHDPICINNAGTYAHRMGNRGDARDWWTLAARRGEPTAIKNLKDNGWPVPEPDFLRQQEQATNRDNAAAALLLLLGGVNAYQQGKAAAQREIPTPSYTPPPRPVNCRTTNDFGVLNTRCE